MKKSIRQYISIVVLFIFFLAFQVVFGHRFKYYGDAGDYYMYGQSMLDSGRLSLSTLTSDFRGYVFPLLMSFCVMIDQRIGIEIGYWFVSAVMFAVLFYIYNRFLDMLWPRKEMSKLTNFFVEAIPIALILVFNYGLVTYTMTDLYAALLIITAFYCILKGLDMKRKLWILLGGLIYYFTYNIRTIYILSLPVLILLLVIYNKNNIKQAALNLFLFWGGLFWGGGYHSYT